MAIPQVYPNVMMMHVTEPPQSVSGLNRLFSAAVVNPQFCRLLLNDPGSALQQGHLGNTFGLSLEQQALILSAKARSLPELAFQVQQALEK
ncbi:MAG: hypothetical protein Fur0043_02350 [Anaerolineales bacterium]